MLFYHKIIYKLYITKTSYLIIISLYFLFKISQDFKSNTLGAEKHQHFISFVLFSFSEK